MSARRHTWMMWLAALGLLSVLGLALAVIRQFDPTLTPFYPKCRFYEATGLRCPGCGSTRATFQLLHGNIGAAFYYNCLLVASLPLVGWFGTRWLWRVWRERRPPPEQWRRTTFLAVGTLVVIVAFWVVRNLPGWPLF